MDLRIRTVVGVYQSQSGGGVATRPTTQAATQTATEPPKTTQAATQTEALPVTPPPPPRPLADKSTAAVKTDPIDNSAEKKSIATTT